MSSKKPWPVGVSLPPPSGTQTGRAFPGRQYHSTRLSTHTSLAVFPEHLAAAGPIPEVPGHQHSIQHDIIPRFGVQALAYDFRRQPKG